MRPADEISTALRLSNQSARKIGQQFASESPKPFSRFSIRTIVRSYWHTGFPSAAGGKLVVHSPIRAIFRAISSRRNSRTRNRRSPTRSHVRSRWPRTMRPARDYPPPSIPGEAAGKQWGLAIKRRKRRRPQAADLAPCNLRMRRDQDDRTQHLWRDTVGRLAVDQRLQPSLALQMLGRIGAKSVSRTFTSGSCMLAIMRKRSFLDVGRAAATNFLGWAGRGQSNGYACRKWCIGDVWAVRVPGLPMRALATAW